MTRPIVQARWTSTHLGSPTTFRVVMDSLDGGSYSVETRRVDAAGAESWVPFGQYKSTSGDAPLPQLTAKDLVAMLDAIFGVG